MLATLSLLLLAPGAFGEERKPPWRVLTLFDEVSAPPSGNVARAGMSSVWEQCGEHLPAIAAVVALQAFMIAGLLMQRARRRRVEEALRQSESRLVLAADSAEIGVWSLDLATERFWVTGLTREMFGFAADEEVDIERFLGLVHPEDRVHVQEAVERASHQSETVRVEYRIVLRDGSVRWMSSRGRRRHTASGAHDTVLGVSVDITESKAAQEAVLYEKVFAETLVNGLPGIFYLYDSEWKLIRWNRNHEVLTGFSADEMKGRELLDWFSPEHKDRVEAAVRQVFKGGEATVEAPLSMKDGRQVPYLFKGIRLDSAGRTFLVGMGVDIAARKSSEEALRRSEEQLRLITDSLPTLIAHVDSRQRYLFVNQPYADWLERQRDEIVGKDVREMLGDEAYEVVGEHIATVLSGQSVTFESQLRIGEAEPRRLLAVYLPEFEGNKVRGYFASIHDVSELERAREEARTARETLYHVGRVTMLDTLSASLAHEIQQPLTGILSNAQAGEMLLEMHPPNLEDLVAIVRDITDDTKRAGAVVRRLRDFLRRQETDFHLVRINDLIDGVVAITNTELMIHGVAVVLDLAADLPPVMGDSVQLQQVLINLTLNAVQAMADSDSDERTLMIRTVRGETGEITVAVEDTGPGIEAGDLARIFEPFHTTKAQGTGMGLAINRSILTAHGGKIWAESRAGAGASICFTLPAAERSAET